jgi:fumarylacetoacetate (FAA) hydrolase
VRFVSFRAEGDEAERCGVVEGEHVRPFPAGIHLIDLLGDLAGAGNLATDALIPLDQLKLLAPIPHPPTVRDFYAFEQHVKAGREARGLEMDPDWYELPVFYFSNPYATIGPHDPVTRPPGCHELDYELEVAAVVSHPGANLDPATAAETHIAGYCIMNDWSARDIQRREMKLSLGPVKGKDFATSMGPMLVTSDELGDLSLDMTATVNGREYSRANLADIHWGFGDMLAYASQNTRVEPGDVIGSGTCGTGCILELSLVHGAAEYPWLQPGDEVVLTVDQLGTLATKIAASDR